MALCTVVGWVRSDIVFNKSSICFKCPLNLWQYLLAPSGALIVMMVYYIYIYTYIQVTFSDFEHLSLSIMLQVSL